MCTASTYVSSQYSDVLLVSGYAETSCRQRCVHYALQRVRRCRGGPPFQNCAVCSCSDQACFGALFKPMQSHAGGLRRAVVIAIMGPIVISLCREI